MADHGPPRRCARRCTNSPSLRVDWTIQLMAMLRRYNTLHAHSYILTPHINPPSRSVRASISVARLDLSIPVHSPPLSDDMNLISPIPPGTHPSRNSRRMGSANDGSEEPSYSASRNMVDALAFGRLCIVRASGGDGDERGGNVSEVRMDEVPGSGVGRGVSAVVDAA
jgi:hypothetical protein